MAICRSERPTDGEKERRWHLSGEEERKRRKRRGRGEEEERKRRGRGEEEEKKCFYLSGPQLIVSLDPTC
ncbi:hypothetical protein CgunFtcFv8_016982 [Champsocephalus gunnari]|uniref:Uncharacterized protein n=1 Tax=Champsocephalus gunnari TaxID=52237 RepID=A0AAN8CXE5_CHAGU|nr:hypothetical protein CgunFtcFv8_016982 [Champsocephalus gunnari]